MPDKQILLLILSGFTVLLMFGMFICLRKQNIQRAKPYVQKGSDDEGNRMMNHISREIHDNVVQSLYALRIHVSMAKTSATDPKQLRSLTMAMQMAEQLINNANNISVSLNSNFIRITSLLNSLQYDLDHLCTPKNIAHEIEVTGNINAIDGEKKLLIYRIAKDAILNVIQHASATSLRIGLFCEQNTFKMIVEDNGLGFPKDKLHAKYSVGINNMRERANHLNGQLNISSEPGSGCTVTLLVNDVNFGM